MAMQIDQALLPTLFPRSHGAAPSPNFNARPNWRLQPTQICIKFLYMCISAVRTGPQPHDPRLSPVEKT
jgi:hypothetical protein